MAYVQLFLFDFDLPRQKQHKNKSFQNENLNIFPRRTFDQTIQDIISHLNAYVIPSESRGYPTASV